MKRILPQEEQNPRVLLVDDKPENLRLLAESLASNDYTIQIARSGEQALRAIRERLPDAILLDINMPGTDGFEVCRQLKEIPEAKSIPVIFITALAKIEEKVRGLELGAVDYITKPFQVAEVAARLETHLELKRLRDTLTEKVAELEDRNARLTLFAKALAHDLRGPLAAVLGFSDLLRISEEISPSPREQAGLIYDGARKMEDIIESLLILAVADRADEHISLTDVEGAFQRSVDGLSEIARLSGTRIEQLTPLPATQANGGWVERVWTNLLSNAIKYGGAPPLITVGCDEPAGGELRYWVEDNGPGLDAAQKQKLFTPFNRLSPGTAEGIGLGLVIVRKIVRQMGGQVGVEDGSSGGSRFFFTLPVNGSPVRDAAPPTSPSAGRGGLALPG